MLASMEVAGLAVAVLLGIVAIIFGYLQWKDRRPRVQLQYAVVTESELIPKRWSTLELVHDGKPVDDPALIILRIIHAGDKAIEAGDFQTDLRLTLVGSGALASVNQTGQRPADFAPELSIDNNEVMLRRTLINPGDMIELQVLASGLPKRVELAGRASDVTFKRLLRVPVGMGSAPGGAFARQDWVLYGFFFPAMAVGLAVLTALSENSATAVRIVGPIVIMVLLVSFLLRAAWSQKRGLMWIPERPPEVPSGEADCPSARQP
jgi:hypothetical protein